MAIADDYKLLQKLFEELAAQKEEALRHGITSLTDLALAVSEKVISVALDTCGDVIQRMILSAAAEAAEKPWAKITISANDARLMGEEGINIRSELDLISEKIELIIVEDAAAGTCIVEFPDQAVDAGAGTQLENIRIALQDAD